MLLEVKDSLEGMIVGSSGLVFFKKVRCAGRVEAISAPQSSHMLAPLPYQTKKPGLAHHHDEPIDKPTMPAPHAPRIAPS